MNDKLKNQIINYFEYVKKVYLSLFKNILTEEEIDRIKNISADIIELDNEEEYKIRLNGDIYIGLNMEKFIRNNKIDVDSFNDLDDELITKINFYRNNQENIDVILKSEFLESAILYLINSSDPLAYGLSNKIANLISKKNSMTISNNYHKEAELVDKFIEVFGEKETYKAILHNDLSSLEFIYNKYVDDRENIVPFKNILKQIKKEFSCYYKSIGRVYYVDSLYYYSNIDYSKYIKSLNKIMKSKKSINIMKVNRVNSIYDCLTELERYKILFSNEESVQIYYAKLEVKKVIDKGREAIIDNYDSLIVLESDIRPILNKIWNYYLSYPDNSDDNINEWYLFEPLKRGYISTDEDYFSANLITSDNIKLANSDSRYKFGFIYSIRPKAVIYSSLQNIAFNKLKKENDLTFNVEGDLLEIENQEVSTLISPRNLLKKTIENNIKCNYVLLNKKYTKKIGILCVANTDEENLCFKKAQDLASKFDLPLVKINE